MSGWNEWQIARQSGYDEQAERERQAAAAKTGSGAEADQVASQDETAFAFTRTRIGHDIQQEELAAAEEEAMRARLPSADRLRKVGQGLGECSVAEESESRKPTPLPRVRIGDKEG